MRELAARVWDRSFSASSGLAASAEAGTTPPAAAAVRCAAHPGLGPPAGSVTVPFDEVDRRLPAVRELCNAAGAARSAPAAPPLVVVCRRGNDSQVTLTGSGLRAQGLGLVPLR